MDDEGAQLHVGVAREPGVAPPRSVVLASRDHSPLKLLNPDNHGHAAWVYQSSYGGGLVGVDHVRLQVRVDDGASLFLSTQASSKVYREARSALTLDAAVGDDALFINWPDPVVCFAGAGLVQQQKVALERRGSLLLVDAFTSGRAARGERWQFERLESRVDVDVAGAPVLREALTLSGAHGALVERLRDFDAFATVVLAGPALSAVCEALDGQVRALQPGLAACSRTKFGAVLRLGAHDAGELGTRLKGLLGAHVHALLGDDPVARKW
jgi:urease accessory protein